MNKYIIGVTETSSKTASSKAKQDIVNILKKENYIPYEVEIPENKIKRVFKAKNIWGDFKKKLVKNDVLVYQYPSPSRVIGDYFLKSTNNLGVKRIVVIHDIESLRYYSDKPKEIKREILFINNFDVIIAHNQTMAKWLTDMGIDKKIIVLGIFDYLRESTKLVQDATDYKNDYILFAGNLKKSSFLKDFKYNTKMKLYGINPEENYPVNIEYEGAFSPEELELKMNGKFGLVWDGETVETCSGILGNYMKYNNPHKTSLYLTLGIPVIIWEESALAKFILENNIGIAVKNLDQLDSVLNSISENEYLKMRKNTLEISNKISNGFYILNALEKALID